MKPKKKIHLIFWIVMAIGSAIGLEGGIGEMTILAILIVGFMIYLIVLKP